MYGLTTVYEDAAWRVVAITAKSAISIRTRETFVAGAHVVGVRNAEVRVESVIERKISK